MAQGSRLKSPGCHWLSKCRDWCWRLGLPASPSSLRPFPSPATAHYSPPWLGSRLETQRRGRPWHKGWRSATTSASHISYSSCKPMLPWSSDFAPTHTCSYSTERPTSTTSRDHCSAHDIGEPPRGTTAAARAAGRMGR